MTKELSVMDFLLDNPKLKFINICYKVAVFQEVIISDPNKSNCFWWSGHVNDEKFVILGAESTKQDLNYALAVTIQLKEDCLAVCIGDQMTIRINPNL